MAKHYFNASSSALPDVSKKMVMFFKERDFEVMAAEADGVYLIQAKKTSGWRTLVGANQAFKIKIYSEETQEIILDCAIGEWASNLTGAGVTALFTGGLTILTGAAGVAWAHKTENDVCEYLEMSLNFKQKKVIDPNNSNVNVSKTFESIPPTVSTPTTIEEKTFSSVNLKQLTAKEKAAMMVKRDIEKFKKALDDGIFTTEEYEFKKQSAENNMDDYEAQILVEENIPKLKEALNNGILSQDEYNEKLSAMSKNIKLKIIQDRKDNELKQKIQKLKEALNNGILSQDEYNVKVAKLKE